MPPTHLQENIDLIVRHEHDFLTRRTVAERVADTVASWMGSLVFVAFHIALLICWILVNTLNIAGIPHFDPAPFEILALIFAFEAILLASFVLLRQTRLGRRADERDHLELQVLLLTEKEITATLTVVRDIAAHLGIHPPDTATAASIDQLTQATPIDEVASTIRENLPAE